MASIMVALQRLMLCSNDSELLPLSLTVGVCRAL
jgi:hypothetical protein